jgi:hypothetical protein
LHCADGPGLVAAATPFLAQAGATSCRWISMRPSSPAEHSCSATFFT